MTTAVRPSLPIVPGIRALPLRTPTLPPATHTNALLLGDAGELVVVDPGTPWDDERQVLAAELAATGARVREIWLTHHHGDHLGAAAWLAQRTGAPIVAHERTARLAGGALPIGRASGEGDTLRAGSVTLEVLHTPGHASDHLCLFDRASGTLIAGDMVASVGTIIVDPPDGDMGDYLASLERLRSLAPRVAVPAHGDPITDPAAKLAEYLAHRRWREARVLEALAARAAPATPAELVPAVYADVSPALFALAERSLLAHLAKLAKDGRVRVSGDGAFATI